MGTGIQVNTKFFESSSILEELGFVAFEKLKYQARFKVVEASAIKQLNPQSNFENIAKKCAGDDIDSKGL